MDVTATPESANGTSPDEAQVAVEGLTAVRLPMGTVAQILEAAPADRTEDTVEVPEWGCSVRIQSLSAAQLAEVKQASITLKGSTPGVVWANSEKMQFQLGVVDPVFSPENVNVLYHKSGRGFARVIAALDRISGIDKEALRKAQESFPQSDDQPSD